MAQRMPEQVGVDVARRLVAEDGYGLLDVREPDEWDAGHAPGAVHLPVRDVPGRRGELAGRPWAVICRSGSRSLSAAAFLLANGVEAVNVAGGMRAWERAGHPMEATGGGDAVVI